MLFALIAYDKPNGLPDRLRIRPSHLEHLERLGDRLKLAGPFLDPAGEPNGSIVIIEAENQGRGRAAVRARPVRHRRGVRHL